MNRLLLLAALSSLALVAGCKPNTTAHAQAPSCTDSVNVAVFSEAHDLVALQTGCAAVANPALVPNEKEKA